MYGDNLGTGTLKKMLVRIAPDFDDWPDDLAEAFVMRGGTAP